MALGDGIRRNFAQITEAERNRFVLAVEKMHDDPAFQFSDGVGFYQKQEQTHELAHGTPVSPHDPATFMVWHRELINRFEALLREVDPDLSLHYWDWTEDPRSASDGVGGTVNLMTPATMGMDDGDVGPPFENFETLPSWDPGHTVIWRALSPGPPPGGTSDSALADEADFEAFANAMSTPHSNVHEYFGGTMSVEHVAASDPFFFLFHSNVDRVFALWQLQPGHSERLDGTTVFGALGSDPVLNETMVPWDGSTGDIPWVPGNTEPTGGIDAKTPKDPSVVTPPFYATNPPQVSVADPPGSVINFNDVPAGETTMRAAVFDCIVCNEPVTFSITAGPTGPYGVLVGTVVVSPKGQLQKARIWLTFTGTTPNTDAPSGSVTIHCEETGQDFDFTIQGNTITRPTVAVELVLDQSGSMDDEAGTMGEKRIDVLKSAGHVFADVIQGGNAAGLVRFDDIGYGPGDPTFPGLAVTDIGSDDPADGGRVALHGAIEAHATNPDGWTSIGAGVELGRDQLNPVTGFEKKAMIVFTDGQENIHPMIASVMGSITSETFAIGLGDASQVSTDALTALTNNTGGYLLLTGTLTPDTDDFFRMKKYFLQILAGVQNNEIVVDPAGKILPGQTVSLPFLLNDADIEATVILVTDMPAIHMRLQTPAGDLIDPTVAVALGADYTIGDNLAFYRFVLPVGLGAGAHSGAWNALLEIDPAIVKRCKEARSSGSASFARASQLPVCNGVRYMVQIHAWSNLKMDARVLQASLEPGATMTVRAVLTEYGTPVDHRAIASATVTRPDDTQFDLPLDEIEPGVFEGTTVALIPGVYTFLVTASGKTVRGIPFSRQQFLTGAVFRGGDNPPPTGEQPGARDILCDVLTCLLSDPGTQAYLKERGIDPGRLLECLEKECAKPRRRETASVAPVRAAVSAASAKPVASTAQGTTLTRRPTSF